MFEQIATFAKPGQTLDSYCDADAIHQIHVNLQVMKLQDPAFTVDKTSDIKDIINAMLKFYHKETHLTTASEFVDKFTYEYDKDPTNTLIETEAVITLTRLVDEAALSAVEINSIITKLIKNLGKSVLAPGKTVSAVKTIKRNLEKKHTAKPFDSIYTYQAEFGFERLELIKSSNNVRETGRLHEKRKYHEYQDYRS